jgi:hypothetical protein
VKLRYIALAGLFIIVCGSAFLPYRIIQGEAPDYDRIWLLSLVCMALILLFREGPRGNSRVLAGIIGLFIGIIQVCSAIDTYLSTFIIGGGIYIQFIGSIIAILGGFFKYPFTSSRVFHSGVILSLIGLLPLEILLIIGTILSIISTQIKFGQTYFQ